MMNRLEAAAEGQTGGCRARRRDRATMASRSPTRLAPPGGCASPDGWATSSARCAGAASPRTRHSRSGSGSGSEGPLLE